MHIKRLDICGFKSFVDPTSIHFDHDIIGIVGPNGCGKSNVVDAIRWAMGEQSAKALRGRAMADVIFNGSDSRTPHGYAEVTITFDNSDSVGAQQLPLEYRDYAEIAVTRRLYRDGTSEYLINKTQVRLRDVTDVFLGTGVGRKAYSIVEQGKIGLIVSARPEDRRILFEEAAGITKYKARKNQAERKMKLTRDNLVRVVDIIGEIERRLGTLKRQAQKARRYLKYRNEMDDLLLWQASHKFLELKVCCEVADAARAAATATVQSQRTEVDVQEAELEVLRNSVLDAEQHAEQAQNTAFLTDNEVREIELRIDRSKDRYQLLSERLQAAHGEQRNVEEKTAELRTERDELAEQLAEIEAEQAQEQALMQIEAEKLAEAEAASDKSNAKLTSLRQQQAHASADIAAAQATISSYEQRCSEVEQRRSRLTDELTRLGEEKTQLDQQRDELETRVKDLAARKHAMCDARDALEAELPDLRHSLVQGERELESQRAELHRERSRLRALEELTERMEGLGAGVRNLLESDDDAITGLVADRIEVPEQYTAPFAGLVGDRLQWVIVSDADRALELLRDLADQRRGRATVVPYHPGQQAVPEATTPEDPQQPGVVGRLRDLLSYRDEDADVVRTLLGDTLLVESDEIAQRLQASDPTCDVVTYDGTVFHTDGRITGGSDDPLASGIVERKREIRELGETVAQRGEAVSEALECHQQLRERVSKLREALDQAKGEAHEAEIALIKGEQDQKRFEERLNVVSKRHTELETELDEVQRSAQTASSERQQAAGLLEQARRTLDHSTETLTSAEQNAEQHRAELTAQQAVFTERKVVFAQVGERAAGSRGALERVGRSYEELRTRVETLEAERNDAATEAGTLAATIVASREEMLQARQTSRDAQAALSEAKGELDDARHNLGLREGELREKRGLLGEANEHLQQQEIEHQRLSLEREHLQQNIRDRFRGLELATVIGDYHARPMIDDTHRSRIKELDHLLDRMGSVNLDAPREYETEAERYEYYTSQHDDLSKALVDLERAIAQMNRESRRRFKHAYLGINEQFQQVFPRMFRGGKAELRLTQPDNLLETGIDILAQPPGKKLANIELMSGGEKAFTAVSLLFAIIQNKPSPFCILDEVDAPLDDTNIDRYVGSIRSMVEHSQFILITHSKRTMQAVDVLYGVTMAEPGVSKIVGVRVGEMATRTEKRSASLPPPPVEAEPVAVA